jgi:hypothetical protein
VVESQPSKLLVAGSIPVSRSRIEAFAGVSKAGARSRNPERFCEGSRQVRWMAFEQAAIKVEKQQEFANLQAAVEQAFLPEKVERFLKQLDRKGIRIREFDAVLSARALEGAVGASAAESSLSAWQLYQVLPLSDQAQMREFYLSKLETVDIALRHKFKKLYQYY